MLHSNFAEEDGGSIATEDFQPLLDSDVEKRSTTLIGSASRKSLSTRVRNGLMLVVSAFFRHGITSLLFLLVLVAFAPGSLVEMIRKCSLDPTVVPMKHFPLASSLKWDVVPGDPDYWSERIYMGEPSRESEIAWNHLIPHGPFLVTDEEAPKLNLTVGLPLVNGGYGIRLGVDHNLHCLRHLRQMYYYDHYWANMTTAAELEWLHEHSVHCLESLRKSIMCYPDLSLHPHYASGGLFHPMNIGSWDTKECVNWNTLQEGLESRRLPSSEWGPQMMEALGTAGKRIRNAIKGIHL